MSFEAIFRKSLKWGLYRNWKKEWQKFVQILLQIYTHTVLRKSVKGHMKERRKIANHIIVRLPKISEKDKTTKSRERCVKMCHTRE